MTTFLRLTDTTGAAVLVNVAAIGAVYPVPKRAPAVQAAVAIAGDIRSPLYVRETVEAIGAALVVLDVPTDQSPESVPE